MAFFFFGLQLKLGWRFCQAETWSWNPLSKILDPPLYMNSDNLFELLWVLENIAKRNSDFLCGIVQPGIDYKNILSFPAHLFQKFPLLCSTMSILLSYYALLIRNI